MNSKILTIIRRLAIIVLIVIAITRVAAPSWKRILVWQLNDNDDLMRILQVRAWLDGQGFYDIINYRLNPPMGGDIHWSRLADIPLALGNIVLNPFVGPVMAEKMAVFAIPLILGGIFAYIAGRTAKVLTNSYIALFVGAFMAVSTPSAMGYFVAGRVDHHGLQLIFMLCAFWGLMSHDKRGAILAGLSIPASLTIGFELAPIQILMVAWVAIFWGIRGNENRTQTIYFTIWLAIGSIFGFLINVPPSEYFIAVNDALSIAQMLPLLAGCLLLGLCAYFFSKQAILIRFGLMGIIGIIVILIAWQFPELRKEPYWQINPLLKRIWLSAIVETFPLTKTDMMVKINLGLFASVVAIATLVKFIFVAFGNKKAANHKDIDNWALITIVLTITTLMAIFWQARIAGQAAAVAIVASSAILTSLYKEKTLIHALIAGLVLNPILPSTIAVTYNKFKPRKKTQYAVGGGATCLTDPAYSHLAKMPKGKIVSHIDFGAHALISTHHSVLAAPYHRNQGNFIAYDIFLTKADEALTKINNNKIDYVAYCLKSAEIGIMERESPNGLMADLKKGKVPNYLKEIPRPNGSDIVAYQVLK